MEQQQTQGNVEYVDTLLDRLLEQYLTRTALPNKEDRAGRPLTPALFHVLARCVIAEGYGE